MIRAEKCHELGWTSRLVWALMLALIPLPAGAQPHGPVRGEPVVRRLFVPANHPEQWPTGPWEPWSVERVDEALRAVRRVRSWSATPALAEAQYEATLLDDALTEGRLRWTFEDHDRDPRFVELEPCHIVLQRLDWADGVTALHSTRPGLAWGRTALGRLGFCSPGAKFPEVPGTTADRYRISGDWALDGQRFGLAIVFALVLPPAQVTTVKLRVPEGLDVTSTVGECRLFEEQTHQGWRIWSIELGQNHECRLRIAPTRGMRDLVPRLTARPDISFTVRPEATRVRAIFEFAAWEGEVDCVELAVPEEMRIANVLYGDLPTTWNSVPGQPGRVTIPLPEKIRGPLRRIELRGLLPGSLNQTWRMPRLGTPGAIELEGHLGVRIQGAQPISSLRHSGLRQFGHDPSPQDGEVFEFRRLRSDATLELSPVQGPRRMSFQSLSVLDNGPPWQAQCHLLWTLGEGSTWSLACQLPAEWEVLDVRREDGAGDDEAQSIDWTLVAQGAWQQVVVELSERLDAEHSVRLQMTLRGPPSGLAGPVPLPLVKPLEGLAAEQVTLLPRQTPTVPEGEEGCRVMEVTHSNLVSSLPESWRSTPIVAELSRKADPSSPLWLVVCEGEAQGRLPVLPPPQAAPIEDLGQPISEAGPKVREGLSTKQTVAITEARAMIRLSAGADQVDEYDVTWLVPARDSPWELRWSFPTDAESPRVLVDGVIGSPLDQSGSFRRGVILPPRDHGKAVQVVVLRYRHDDGVRDGLRQRRLALPVPELPVAKTFLELRTPATLLLATPPGEFRSLADGAIPGSNGWWRKSVEPRFNPLAADHWLRLIQGTRGGTAPEPTAELLWRGEAAGAPDRVELTTWNRAEAEGLGWVACLACLALGLFSRQRWPLRASGGIALMLGLLGTIALATSPLFWPLLQSAILGCLISLLVPERWTAERSPRSSRPSFARTSGGAGPAARVLRALGVGLGLWLGVVSGAQSQNEPPLAILGPLESLGDILIPLNPNGDSVDERYVSPEFRGNVAEPLRQVSLPNWLCQQTTLRSLSAGSRGDLLEARLVGVRVGTEAVEIPLGLSGLMLADELACRVNGQPHEVWRIDSSGGLVISLAAHEHLGADLGDAPRPPSVLLPGESAGLRDFSRSSSIDALTELEIALRLLPIPDETLRRARRVNLPVAAVTRLLQPGAPQAGRWTLVQPVALHHPSAPTELHEEWGVLAPELQWRPPSDTPAPRQESIRVESWNLVEFDGQVTTTHSWARYLPGGIPVQTVRWTIPRGMTVRRIEGPAVAGETWELLEGGDRLLSLELAEAQTQTFEMNLDLIHPAEGNPLELRFPDPSDNTVVGRFRFDLRQVRVALRSPPDRQLTVSSPVIDQPLRALTPSELTREPRFGEVTPDLGFDLDRPLALMVLVQSVDRPLQAATVEQRGEIRRGAMEWHYRASDVRSNQSVFHYELLIDSRVEIRRVQVQEQKTDRVARWSREGDRLTIFLASRAGTSQTLEISGVVPLPETGEVVPPRVTLQGLRPTIERRLLTVIDDRVSARLTQGDAPGRVPGGSLLLFDAPSNPEAEWPILRLTGQDARAPERPDAPEAPADDHLPEESPNVPRTAAPIVRHAELELSAPSRRPWTCLVRLWLSSGQAEKLNWTVPPGSVVQAMDWNGVPLDWKEEISSNGHTWTCATPPFTNEGRLQVVWQLPMVEPHDAWSIWPHSLPELPHVTNAECQSLSLIWNSSQGDWLSIASPWREGPSNGFEELPEPQAKSRLGQLGSTQVALGSARAIEEWRNGGTMTGLKVWPGHLIITGGMGAAILVLAWLVWWLSPLWRVLQTTGCLTVAMVGLLWWWFFAGGGWGFSLAAVFSPWALWDVRTALNRSVQARG